MTKRKKKTKKKRKIIKEKNVKKIKARKKTKKITRAQLQEIAETKMKDLNAANIDSAISMIAGTARSMGVEVVD